MFRWLGKPELDLCPNTHLGLWKFPADSPCTVASTQYIKLKVFTPTLHA